MRFGLLGPVCVQLDAACAPVRIEQRMPEILLAALLLNAGKVVPSVKLTTALWGYDPPPSAASSLYNHMGRLRRVLGPDGGGRIRTASAGYVIDVEPAELDATEFAALCARASRLRETGDWAAASERFAAALSLWRGEPADGVSGLDEWEARVQELRETRLQALEARIDSDLRLGRHRETTAELQALALEYPLHESFHRQLMLALYRGGRQTDALNAYQKLRHSLSRELGIDPSTPVQRIHEAILNADPQLDEFHADSSPVIVRVLDAPAPPAPPAPPPPPSSSPAAPPASSLAILPDEAADPVDGEIHHTVVNGIPVLLCRALPGSRQRAGITFRVGVADEPLARAGITHLIAHLALHRLGVSEVHHDGATSAAVTHFQMQGSADEAIEFIHGVCANLHDLPFERLQTEKSVLATEASHRGLGWVGQLAAYRYGARGYGTSGFGELGLAAVTPDDLRDWASAYFTRDNAVLWFSGDEIPAGLDPRLPAGRRRPLPAASSVPLSTSAYIAAGQPGFVGVSAVVRRGSAAMLFTQLLERELFRHLRHQSGLSYAIRADYVARDADYAEIHASADALPGTHDRLVRALVSVLDRLRAGEIDPGQLEIARGRLIEERQSPDAAARTLPGRAADLLFGRPHPNEAAALDRLRGLSADDVRAAAAEALKSVLLLLPGRSLAVEDAGYACASTGSGATAVGSTYRRRDEPDTRLVVGAAAVSLHRDGLSTTVQYTECVAMQAWPDGARKLWNPDGSCVAIEPNLFDAPHGFLAPLDAAVPPECVVWEPARDPRQIPRRAQTAEAHPAADDGRRAQTAAARIVRFLVRVAFSVFLAGSVLFTALAIGMCFDHDPADGVSIGVIVSVSLFDLGVCVLPMFLLGRRLRRYKNAR